MVAPTRMKRSVVIVARRSIITSNPRRGSRSTGMRDLTMQASVPNPFWQMIDGVVVINLDSRPDRWTQFQATTRNVIPAEKLHRLAARLGRDIPGFNQHPWFRGRKRDRTWAARAGVTQSHRQALLKAR